MLISEIEVNVNCQNKSHFEQHCQWVQELPEVGGGDGQPQGEEGQTPGGDQVVDEECSMNNREIGIYRSSKAAWL